MKKGIALIFFVVCFLLGTIYGSSSHSEKTPHVAASSNLTQQIKEYEQKLSQGEEIITSYSEMISEGVVPKSTPVSSGGVAHNNVSQFGQDAADLLKTTVREVLRMIVKACDQLITE